MPIFHSCEKIESKKCKKCLLLKTRENYKKSRVGKFGLSDNCISCKKQSIIEQQEKRNIRSKEYYKKNKKTLLVKGYLAKVKRLRTDPEFKLRELLSELNLDPIIPQNIRNIKDETKIIKFTDAQKDIYRTRHK